VSFQDHDPLDEVLELPDVAGPRVALEHLEGVFPDPFQVAPLLAVVPLDEVGRQHRDVLGALPKRGDPDGDHVQPEVQVGPEPPLGDLLLEVLVGGGDDPHVHGDRLVPAHRRHRLLLEHPEQLHLQVGAHLADLVEEDGPVMGRLELPGRVACAP
jgi:hypothetical protein